MTHNGFTVQVDGISVELPHKDGGLWSLQEIVECARKHPEWDERICPDGRRPPCRGMIVSEGTLIESPPDPGLVSIMSPAEVELRLSEDRLWGARGQ